MSQKTLEEILEKDLVTEETEVDFFDNEEVVDDEPGAHKEHRRISRFGRSSHRFNNTMKGNK